MQLIKILKSLFLTSQ